MTSQNRWMLLSRILFVLFLLTAALNMLHIHAGFLTNHLADLTVPAWMYVVARSPRDASGYQRFLQRSLGHSPEIAALTLFVASTLTEVSQYYWPEGPFRGRFDPWDIVAYAVGLIAVYIVDKRMVNRAPVAA